MTQTQLTRAEVEEWRNRSRGPVDEIRFCRVLELFTRAETAERELAEERTRAAAEEARFLGMVDELKGTVADLETQFGQVVQRATTTAMRETALEAMAAERDALNAFKAFVHQYLDKAGVPSDPEPEKNREHGCRIEGRLNFLVAQRDRCERYGLASLPGVEFCRKGGARVVAEKLEDLRAQLAKVTAERVDAALGLRARCAVLTEALEGATKIINTLLHGGAPLATTFHYGEKINRILSSPDAGVAEWLRERDAKTRAEMLPPDETCREFVEQLAEGQAREVVLRRLLAVFLNAYAIHGHVTSEEMKAAREAAVDPLRTGEYGAALAAHDVQVEAKARATALQELRFVRRRLLGCTNDSTHAAECDVRDNHGPCDCGAHALAGKDGTK